MASEITIPRLGWNMDEGTFVGWLKADGDLVKTGEPLFNLEGDKATQEIESLETGILHITAGGPKDGDKVAVGAIVGYLLAPGEPAPFDSQGRAKAAPPAAPADRAERQRRAISPRARRAAQQLGVNAANVTGSGKTGRIVERDILAAARTSPARAGRIAVAEDRVPVSPRDTRPLDYEELAVSPIRRKIADRMIESKQATAAVTITTTVDATNLVNLRRQFKAVQEIDGTPSVGYMEIVIKLLALALEKHPMLNSRWRGDQIQIGRNVHIGIAVDTEAGLMVPVIRDVAALSLRELGSRSRALADRARAGKLTAADLSESTFTVSNLGQLGVEFFTPLINPPECAILGLGRIGSQVVVESKQFVERDRMFLSLTFDHRIVDGAPAARFLQTLSRLIENPGPWLMP